MKILHGRAFLDGVIRNDVRIEIADGLIQSVEQRPGGTHRGVVSAGFIDLHVHGAAGRDFMDGSPEADLEIAQAHARWGTTAMVATTLSGSRADVAAAVRAAVEARGRDRGNGARIVGMHLEGPYIAPGHAGAQDPGSIRPPDEREFGEWIDAADGLPLIATVAPEIDGVVRLIHEFSGRVLFSVGHTGATYEEAVAAFEAGASHSTHLFNAMTGIHHRAPGAVGAVMSTPEVTAELIADGKHIHPAVLRIAALSLSGRSVLVTDAMRACGGGEGTYRLYGHQVDVRDGAARLADGTLAGSVLTMRDAVRNMVELCALPLEIALPMATSVPARVLGIDAQCGTIAPGRRADLVMLDERLEVERVWIGGEEVK